MYHPTTRVLTLLELLQSHREISGPEIAAHLDVEVRLCTTLDASTAIPILRDGAYARPLIP